LSTSERSGSGASCISFISSSFVLIDVYPFFLMSLISSLSDSLQVYHRSHALHSLCLPRSGPNRHRVTSEGAHPGSIPSAIAPRKILNYRFPHRLAWRSLFVLCRISTNRSRK
jgi:hypothetical protein